MDDMNTMNNVYIGYAQVEARVILDTLERRASLNRHAGNLEKLELKFKWSEVVGQIDRQRLNFTWNEAVGNAFIQTLTNSPLATVWFERETLSYTIHYRVSSTPTVFHSLSSLKNA